MDNEDEHDDNEQGATASQVPPELVDIERDFANRAGLGMRAPSAGWY